MKKGFLILGATTGSILLILGLGILFFYLHYPNIDKAASLVVERTPARLARGEYLAKHVTLCMDCHSTRDYNYFSAPVVDGTEGMGGERWGPEMGFPGTIYAGNITPAGIGSLTDGELLRIITSGVLPDGTVLFPLMMYPHYNEMSDEDLASIVAYIRTLPAKRNDVPHSTLKFPVSMFIRAVPANHEPRPEPDRADIRAFGKYLVNAAGCADCHTRSVKGTPVKGMEFAGGFEFRMPSGTIRTANITPDEATGIGLWTEDIFVRRFKEYATDSAKQLDPNVVGYHTVMPWTMYAGMTEDDLRAMYAYLKTLPAVSNAVVKYEPPGK